MRLRETDKKEPIIRFEKGGRTFLWVIFMPLFLAVTVFLSCLIFYAHDNVNGPFFYPCLVMLASPVVCAIMGAVNTKSRYKFWDRVLISRWQRRYVYFMTPKGWYRTVMTAYICLCAEVMSFPLWIVSENDGTIGEAAIALAIPCALLSVMSLLTALRVRRDLRIERQDKETEEQCRKLYRERAVEVYGEEEEIQHVRAGCCEKKKHFDEFIEILCGDDAEEVKKCSYGDFYELTDRLEERGHILFNFETEETAITAEVLRMMVCCLCDNFGVPYAVKKKELADELEACETEQIKRRRFEGVSTYAHDVNAIERILRSKGLALVSIKDCEVLAVARSENVERLAEIAPPKEKSKSNKDEGK